MTVVPHGTWEVAQLEGRRSADPLAGLPDHFHGEASVVQEHFASNLLRGRLLALARAGVAGPRPGPRRARSLRGRTRRSKRSTRTGGRTRLSSPASRPPRGRAAPSSWGRASARASGCASPMTGRTCSAPPWWSAATPGRATARADRTPGARNASRATRADPSPTRSPGNRSGPPRWCSWTRPAPPRRRQPRRPADPHPAGRRRLDPHDGAARPAGRAGRVDHAVGGPGGRVDDRRQNGHDLAGELTAAIAALDGRDVTLALGPEVDPATTWSDAALVTTSPSINPDHPTTEPRLRSALADLETAAVVPVVSEIDLFLRLCPATTAPSSWLIRCDASPTARSSAASAGMSTTSPHAVHVRWW